MATFSERFKYLRESMGWTQAQAANELGIARATVAGYEANNKIPREKTLHKIADRFNVSVDFILGRIDEDYPGAYKDGLEVARFRGFSTMNMTYHLGMVLELLLGIVTKEDSIEFHEQVRNDLIQTAKLFDESIDYSCFFQNTNEIRAVFYSTLIYQLDILENFDYLFRYIDHPDKGKLSTYYKAKDLDQSESYKSAYECYLNNLNLINQVDEDLVTLLNPFYEYFRMINEIISCNEKEYEDLLTRVDVMGHIYFSDEEDEELKTKTLVGIKKELIRLRSIEQPFTIARSKRTDFALLSHGKKTQLTKDESDFLSSTLEMYRKQKEKWVQ